MVVSIEQSKPYVYVTGNGGVTTIRTSDPDRLEIMSGGSVKMVLSHENALILAAELENVVSTWHDEYSKWHKMKEE